MFPLPQHRLVQTDLDGPEVLGRGSWAGASFRFAATMPVSSLYGFAPAEPNRFPMYA